MNRAAALKSVLREYWVVLLAPGLLLAPLLLTGKALFWGTPALQFVPWWSYALESLRQGSLPLWNPLNGMGAPLLANYQSAFFYPPNWLLLVAGWVAGDSGIAYSFTILAMLHLAWAGLGMGFLLRRLEFPWLAQVIGGIAFGLSGYLVARLGFFSMVWVGAWLPWMIYFAQGIVDRGEKVYLSPGLTVSIALQFFAGHAQLAWYSLLLGGAWITATVLGKRSIRKLLTVWTSFLLAAVFAAGIAAVQLVPTFEYLRNSYRADAFAPQEAMTYSFWPWRVLTIVSPDIFGNPGSGDYWGYASFWEDHLYQGMLPLLLAIGSIGVIFRGKKNTVASRRRLLVIGCLLILLISFLLALGNNIPLFPFLYEHVPTFSMFQAPTRFMILATFVIPLLAAVGIERWRCPAGKGLYWFRLATAGAFAVTLGAGLSWLLMNNIRLTFIRSTAITGFWGLCFGVLTLVLPQAEKKGLLPAWRNAVILAALVDLLLVGWGLNPGVSLEFYAPDNPNKANFTAGGSGGRIFLDSSSEYELKFHRFLRFRDFQPLEDWSGMRGVILPNLNLLDRTALTANFDPLVTERYQRWITEMNRLTPTVRDAWLAYSGVAYVEQIDVGAESGVRFDPLLEPQRWRWFSCARQFASSEAAWEAFRAELGAPPRENRLLIIEGAVELSGAACQPGAPARISLISEKPDQVILRIQAETAGWLELMDSWYPGWTASVSGTKVKILPADTQFRSVQINPGDQLVTISYHPTGFYFGCLFSILVLLLGMFLLFNKKRS